MVGRFQEIDGKKFSTFTAIQIQKRYYSVFVYFDQCKYAFATNELGKSDHNTVNSDLVLKYEVALDAEA